MAGQIASPGGVSASETDFPQPGPEAIRSASRSPPPLPGETCRQSHERSATLVCLVPGEGGVLPPLLAALLSCMVGRGRSIEQICAYLRMARERLLDAVVDLGLVTPPDRLLRTYRSPRYWTVEQIARLTLDLWPSQKSLEEIAAELGRSRKSVTAKARSLGLYCRKRPELQALAAAGALSSAQAQSKTALTRAPSFASPSPSIEGIQAPAVLPDAGSPSVNAKATATRAGTPYAAKPDGLLPGLTSPGTVARGSIPLPADGIPWPEAGIPGLNVPPGIINPGKAPKSRKPSKKLRKAAAKAEATPKPRNAGKTWTDEEHLKLAFYYDRGLTAERVAVLMERTPDSIRTRWTDVGLEHRKRHGLGLWTGDDPDLSPVKGNLSMYIQKRCRLLGIIFWVKKSCRWDTISPLARKSTRYRQIVSLGNDMMAA